MPNFYLFSYYNVLRLILGNHAVIPHIACKQFRHPRIRTVKPSPGNILAVENLPHTLAQRRIPTRKEARTSGCTAVDDIEPEYLSWPRHSEGTE